MPRDFLWMLRAKLQMRQLSWPGNKQPLPPMFRALELGGEVGELLNVVKKLERERLGWEGSRETLEHLAEEIGDALICLDLLAQEFDIDLRRAAADAFNKVSIRLGTPERLQ